MEFKRVFRGYDPSEVDRHLNETAAKEQQIRREQKERIDELVDENCNLRKLVAQYQANEQAIVQSLIASHSLADSIKLEADKYCQSALNRAKIFVASWRAYSSTLIASLSDDEVRQFNFLQRKIENLVRAYECGEVDEAAATEAANAFVNPITRIEQSTEQVIDLKELTTPTQSLEEICAELGLALREPHRKES